MPEEQIIQKLLEHDEQLEFIRENMATKGDFSRVLTQQEEMITILKRLDEERIFTVEWIKRIEKEVDDHRVEITKMKQLLKVN
jgi:uncharacterized protein YjgD (DUF1641 family)